MSRSMWCMLLAFQLQSTWRHLNCTSRAVLGLRLFTGRQVRLQLLCEAPIESGKQLATLCLRPQPVQEPHAGPAAHEHEAHRGLAQARGLLLRRAAAGGVDLICY